MDFLSIPNAILLNTLATAMMTGVIWLVQLVHYPLFAGLAERDFKKWHEFHSRQITFIVAPLMVSELALSIFIFVKAISLLSALILLATLGIWLSTFLLSVPIHNSLAQGSGDRSRDLLLIQKLVRTNWPRTLLYSLKLALCTYALFKL